MASLTSSISSHEGLNDSIKPHALPPTTGNTDPCRLWLVVQAQTSLLRLPWMFCSSCAGLEPCGRLPVCARIWPNDRSLHDSLSQIPSTVNPHLASYLSMGTAGDCRNGGYIASNARTFSQPPISNSQSRTGHSSSRYISKEFSFSHSFQDIPSSHSLCVFKFPQLRQPPCWRASLLLNPLRSLPLAQAQPALL